MEIIILGSGTGFPRVERAAPGILVKLGRCNILLDSGPGTMRQLVKLNLNSNDIDLVLYTHLHPDHTLGLMELLFCAKYEVVTKNDLCRAVRKFVSSMTSGENGFRTKPLHLIGPPGFRKFYENILKAYSKWLKSKSYRLSITEVKESKVNFKGWRFQSREMTHVKVSVGYRIEAAGKRLVYSGDTAYCPNIVRLAKKADILILECSTSNEVFLPNHLTPSSAVQIAAEAQAKRLILTHIYKVADKFDLLKQARQARAVRKWSGPVQLARDLMRIKL